MFVEFTTPAKSISIRKPVAGVGINDAEYKTMYRGEDKEWCRCPYYTAWVHMLHRCYSEKCHKARPTYIGCTVSEEWKIFSNFKRWMKAQSWEGNTLDKDLRVKGNKIYSSETCIFISVHLNTIFGNKPKRSSGLPRGVYYNEGNKDRKYFSKMNKYGKEVYLGAYKTKSETEKAYRDEKLKYIIEVAQSESPEIRDILISAANRL